MAKKQSANNKKVRERYRTMKRLCALTVLAACGIVWWSGVETGVRFMKSFYISCMVTTGICATFWLVIKAVASYEERNGG
jgi:hypothetical protein